MARSERTKPSEVMGYTLERIRDLRRSLSVSEVRVVDSILEHPYEVLQWSAAELGEASGTSGATVVRTCRRLGFEGLGDLRLTLARDLGWPAAKTALSGEKRNKPLIEELFADASRALTGMITKQSTEAIKRAVDQLVAANEILVVAAGPSTVFAQDFVYNARLAGMPAQFWPDSMMQTVVASGLGRKDVCLAISVSGVNSLTIEAAENAKAAGAKVVAVTGYRQSRLAEIANTMVVADTFDYSTTSQAAINSAGMLLILRGLVISMTQRADAANGGTARQSGNLYSALKGFTYRPR